MFPLLRCGYCPQNTWALGGAWKPYLVKCEFNKWAVWMREAIEEAKPHRSLLLPLFSFSEKQERDFFPSMAVLEIPKDTMF